VADGDGKKNSTNGTWIFAEEMIKMHDNMIFKAGLLLFRVKMHKA
jgi:hypothetical protein